MVWAATWAGKRFCVAAEISVRFRKSAAVGVPLRVEATVEAAVSKRPGKPTRVVYTEAVIVDETGATVAEATGKYMAVTPERNRDVVATLVDEPQTARAATALRAAAGPD